MLETLDLEQRPLTLGNNLQITLHTQDQGKISLCINYALIADFIGDKEGYNLACEHAKALEPILGEHCSVHPERHLEENKGKYVAFDFSAPASVRDLIREINSAVSIVLGQRIWVSSKDLEKRRELDEWELE